MRKMLLLFSITLCFTILFSGCAPSYPQVQQQLKPGMTYKHVVELIGKEGLPVTDNDKYQYQWYVDDYVRVLMKFIESDEASTFNDYILHSYRFEMGYAHIHIGMTYRELARKIGKPFREGDCFGEGSSFGGTFIWKLHDHLFLHAVFKLPETTTDPEEMEFPYDYVISHFRIYTTAEGIRYA